MPLVKDKKNPHQYQMRVYMNYCILVFVNDGQFGQDDICFWFVARACGGLGNRLDNAVSGFYFTKNGVVAIQMRSRNLSDEELAAVGSGACIGHGQFSGAVEFVSGWHSSPNS